MAEDLRDETRCFIMRCFQKYVDLFYVLDKTKDQHVQKSEAGALLNLGFSTVGYDDS